LQDDGPAARSCRKHLEDAVTRVVEGSLARKLHFLEEPESRVEGPALRLTRGSMVLRGPDKYRALDHRRRQAQIRARRLLDQIEETSS
jgi:hypothetical protein